MTPWNWSQNDITFDQNCWTFDGNNGCIVTQPPVSKQTPSVGRGSGPTNGIRREGPGYTDYWEDVKRESDRIRIKRDDEDIVKFLHMILSKGIL